MTKDEAAVVSAYTGILLGEFSDFHAYVERVLGRPVWTHELGKGELGTEIREASRGDFVSIKVKE